ncbi:divalent-cation tolerance protein CutA [Sphingomicrobium aestuariivivum]|uniref:divalent-cation tolerance protein CutA n=1 Tax=Sphingomicrobium aestuariivivum TaxID=1582356 RepID=UPI001FD6CFC4|nr:divalent-cation tolerance protein CutA [Sphingomicrobium aestuariivivum]MCJ8191937.1 divalent-cation tolerance protein CutA [Sphingomicrobium aestuariivivum]
MIDRQPVSVFIMCSALGEAQEIARTLVEERHAACCNILGQAKSIYRWEGQIETGAEFPVIAKTTMDCTDALIARVKDLHGFSVPAITVWPIAKAPGDYHDWILENSGPADPVTIA